MSPRAPSFRPFSARWASVATKSLIKLMLPLLCLLRGVPRDRLVVVSSAFDVAHDVLDAGVVVEPVHREVLAVPRVLEAAVRHLGHERYEGVDPHAPEIEIPSHPHRPAVVAGPHARGQPVLDAVGP